MYFDFAMSTNLRGRDIVKFLLPYVKKSHFNLPYTKQNRGRYLDVGCAYGGFLIAFAEQGFDVLGIEIEPNFANYGIINCKEYKLNDKVIIGDFLNVDEVKLGKFDLITCNDVIEHVKNPETTLRKLANLLNPGGVLFLEIPNRHCIKFVEKDGHFSLFGITLLQRNIADAYIRSIAGNLDYLNQMGEYYDLGYYEDMLSRLGLTVEVHSRHTIGNIDDVPTLLNSLSNEFTLFYNHQRRNIDYFLGETLVDKYLEYLSNVTLDYCKARSSGGMDIFKKKYLASFWSIIAVKKQ
jgi:SAM-dependent methyltransferase